MRPRRIARRILARLRHWGGPHVHCPGCGADSPVPAADVELRCFTCGVRCIRVDLTGDEDADWQAIRGRITATDGTWSVVWRPLLIDTPSAPPGAIGVPMEAAFLYGSSD